MVVVEYKDRKVRCVNEGFIFEIYLDKDISKDEFDELAKACVEFLKGLKRGLSKQTYSEVMEERGRQVNYCEDLCHGDKVCFEECIENYYQIIGRR